MLHRRGLNTQPRGEPVLSLRMDEHWLTDCGRSVRKFWIQAQVAEGKSRAASFSTRMSDMIVLKAEL